MEEGTTTATTATGSVVSSGSGAAPGTAFKLFVSGLPKRWTAKQLEKELKTIGVNFTKVKKLPREEWGMVTFKDQEQLEQGRTLLTNHKIRDKHLVIQDPKPRGRAQPRAPTTPLPLADVVTPWHK